MRCVLVAYKVQWKFLFTEFSESWASHTVLVSDSEKLISLINFIWALGDANKLQVGAVVAPSAVHKRTMQVD